ncbi:hypothetical protein D9611_010408 [Ephemerocybe angulata]|uniref:Major facilitator superfamily (MFS) profile domain-containing protein n=1 Tax=Ephemerocybe angulata TaxID=980116 RepID=A0A8H5BVX4_9AGAR|nr:hypothetical protein D9611_010408 [Tulosesus angulatus]
MVDIAMVALLGIVLGPMYPMVFNQAARILPRHIYLGAVGWISSFGQAGSAIIPFITGAISQKYGIKSLHPMLVTILGVMIGLLWLTPDRPPKETPGVESPKSSVVQPDGKICARSVELRQNLKQNLAT